MLGEQGSRRGGRGGAAAGASGWRAAAVGVLLTAAMTAGTATVAGAATAAARTGPAPTSDAASGDAASGTTPTPVPSPLVTGPVTGGTPDVPVNAAPPAILSEYHYSEKEYFLAGTATAYRPVGTWGVDGRWSVAPFTTAAYKTRILVRMPTDPARFNGTVVVEWFNETAGRDSDPDWGSTYAELMRAGYGYVGVSAQALGVVGGAGFSLPIPDYHPLPLVEEDPTRYAGLSHPGDQYSYDIFSQAAESLLHPQGVRPLGNLHPRYLIADGESQSASYMTTYYNAIEPVTRLFSGFLIHSRGTTGAAIGPAFPSAVPKVARLRTDLGVPVLVAETETDPFGLLDYQPAIQPDSSTFRLWELAGTSHADASFLAYGVESGHLWDPGAAVPNFAACGRFNDGPGPPLLRSAVATLGKWVASGQPPPSAPRFTLDAAGTAIARDALGNAEGGIRTPAVDVPVSTLSGVFDPHKSIICALFGSTVPFTASRLKSLYPTHGDYVGKVAADAKVAVSKGWLLPFDAALTVERAQAAPVPG